MILTQIWDTIVVNPMVNMITLFYDLLGNNMGPAIIALTVVVSVLLVPLTLRQHKQQLRMRALQPKLRALQKKYNTGRPEDKRKLSSETFKLYKESGISPLGCLGPLIIQVPIWIGFYRAVLVALPLNPEGIVNLSRALYSWNPGGNELPFNSVFLGVDMGVQVSQNSLPIAISICLLVGISFWVRQRMSSPPGSGDPQQQTTRLLLWLFPLMIGYLTWQFPGGLALYFLVSSVVGILLHWFLTGREPLWGPKGILFRTGGAANGGGEVAEQHEDDTGERKEGKNYETYVGVHRKNSRRGNRSGSKRAGGKSRRH